MLAVLEMLEKENKKIFRDGKREGKEEARKETAKKLLNAKIPIEIIIEATGLKATEISKLKK